MKYFNKIAAILSLSLLLCGQASAQDIESEKIRIREFFWNSGLANVGDSTRVYAFAFIAEVKAVAGQKNYEVIVSSNDSIGFALYPGYDFLKTVDYGLFLQKSEAASFIFPVFIDVIGNDFPAIIADTERSKNLLLRRAFSAELTKKVYNLFNYGPESHKYIYMEPTILRIDNIIRN